MFGVCRNPLYVGNMLVYSGLFLFHGNPLVVVVGCLVFAFIYQSIIYAEEEFLADKFGQGYRDYCRNVPRWGLKLSAFASSTEGMVPVFHFNYTVNSRWFFGNEGTSAVSSVFPDDSCAPPDQ